LLLVLDNQSDVLLSGGNSGVQGRALASKYKKERLRACFWGKKCKEEQKVSPTVREYGSNWNVWIEGTRRKDRETEVRQKA